MRSFTYYRPATVEQAQPLHELRWRRRVPVAVLLVLVDDRDEQLGMVALPAGRRDLRQQPVLGEQRGPGEVEDPGLRQMGGELASR